MNEEPIQPGTLLIAPPAVQNNFWAKSVVLITEHHDRGSLGLMLNRRTSLTAIEFGKQCGKDIKIGGHVYIGGPVNQKSFCMLHSNDWSTSNTLQIDQRLSISSTPTLLEDLDDGARPTFFRLFIGLCGWAPDQLLSEYKGDPPFNHASSWLTFQSKYDIVFNYDGKEQWTQALERCGQEFAQNVL